MFCSSAKGPEQCYAAVVDSNVREPNPFFLAVPSSCDKRIFQIQDYFNSTGFVKRTVA